MLTLSTDSASFEFINLNVMSQQELYFIKSKEMYQNFWVKNDPMYHMGKYHHRIFNVINSDVFFVIQILLFKDYVILNVFNL